MKCRVNFYGRAYKNSNETLSGTVPVGAKLWTPAGMFEAEYACELHTIMNRVITKNL